MMDLMIQGQINDCAVVIQEACSMRPPVSYNNVHLLHYIEIEDSSIRVRSIKNPIVILLLLLLFILLLLLL